MKTFLSRLLFLETSFVTSIRERKSTRLGNHLIVFFLFLTFFLLIVDELLALLGTTDHWATVFDGVFLLLYLISLIFFRRGLVRTGKILFVIVGNFHVLMISLYFGPGSGATWYFLATFLIPMLLFSPEDWKSIAILMILTLILAIGNQLAFVEFGAMLEHNSESKQVLYAVNTVLIFLIIGASVAYFFQATYDAETRLEAEQNRSEKLLLNILPAQIAERLKNQEDEIANEFTSVSVLFSDIVGFTSFSEKIDPSELVRVLNDLFSRFDDLTEEFHLEKIKTIGDAYLAVAGIPEKSEMHAENAYSISRVVERA